MDMASHGRARDAWMDKVSLKHILNRINMSEIMKFYDDQKPDEFGCKICEHVLLNIEKQFTTDLFSVRSRRLQSDGDTPIHAIEEFKAIKTVIPIADSKFCRDQFGISNQSKPDGVWVIEVCTPDGHCRRRVPVFVEIDSGVEGKFRNQSRIVAMKMWQSVAVGSWIDSAPMVATLRMETQLIDKQLIKKTRDDHHSLSPQDLIVQHLRDLTGACAEILHGLTLSCVVATIALKVDRTVVLYDKFFFEHLLESMQKTDRRDFHFFIGPFDFKSFDFGNNLMATPSLEADPLGLEPQKEEVLYNESTGQPDKKYFKQDKKDKKFMKFTGNRPGADSNARYVDGFWDEQGRWKCSIEYTHKEFDKHTSILTNTAFVHSRMPMHCVKVKRTDVSAFKVPELVHNPAPDAKKLSNSNKTVIPIAQRVDLPDNMYYIEDILYILDMFIRQAHGDPLKYDLLKDARAPSSSTKTVDEEALLVLLNSTFNTKGAYVRIPEMYSYRDLVSSDSKITDYANYFLQWSGFHLFIEPFISVMENTLFRVTYETLEKADDFQSYSSAMKEFKRNLARGDLQLNMNRVAVEFPRKPDGSAKSLNLASRCLLSYDYDSDSKQEINGLDKELHGYLYDPKSTHPKTMNNEYLVMACKWFKCFDKPSLSALVKYYMTSEQIRSSINAKLAGLPEGHRSEILHMFETVFTDTKFLMKNADHIVDPQNIRLEFHDEDLEYGVLKMHVRLHWVPYTLTVNFDNVNWKLESVYQLGSHNWITTEGNNLEDAERKNAKNLVYKIMRGATQNITKLEGFALWDSQFQQHDVHIGWLWNRENNFYNDKTKLLRALSLTTLKLMDWNEINRDVNVMEKCSNPSLQDAFEWHFQNNLVQVGNTDNGETGFRLKFFDRRAYHQYLTDIREHTKLCKIDYYTMNTTKLILRGPGEGIEPHETQIRNIRDYFIECQTARTPNQYNVDADKEVVATTRIQDLVQNSDPRFFSYDHRISANRFHDGNAQKVKNIANEQQFEYRENTHPNTELTRNDIVLHEVLGTFFGMSYSSRKKRAQFRFYLHERFPVLKKRYVPYNIWRKSLMSSNSSKNYIPLFNRFIAEDIETMEKYQKYTKLEVFTKEFLENAYLYDDYEKQNEIRKFVFENVQVLSRHLHIVWSWKWLLVKYLCVLSFKDWYVQGHVTWQGQKEVRDGWGEKFIFFRVFDCTTRKYKQRIGNKKDFSRLFKWEPQSEGSGQLSI